MKPTDNNVDPATTCADTLTILREVSETYRRLKRLRKLAAKAAKVDHTYVAIAEATGLSESGAYMLINRDNAA